MPFRTLCCAPGSTVRASRKESRCARGCTGSRPTPAWMPSATTRGDQHSPRSRRPKLRARALAPAEVTWLQPIPDAILEPTAPRDSEPETVVLTQETIGLAFLTVIQLLSPQQRAVLILCDVLGWSAKETAELLDISVAAVNSALQRARATLRTKLPSRRPEWPAGTDTSATERELLRRYIEACEKADIGAFESILREDAVCRMPPQPEVSVGRDAILKLFTDAGFGTEAFGQLRCVTTRANRQPAVAVYVLQAGDSTYRPVALDILQIEEDFVTEIVTFGPDIFPIFALPLTMDPEGGRDSLPTQRLELMEVSID